jgi:NMT1/THI5 like
MPVPKPIKNTFLRAALRSIGPRPDADVSILQMGGTLQVASSLIAGKVDAGVSGESSVLLIHQGKMKQLPGASAKEMKILSSGAPLITTRRYISRDRRTVMQFMRADRRRALLQNQQRSFGTGTTETLARSDGA